MSIKSREIRKARQNEWERRERRKRWMVWGVGGAAAVALAALLGYLVWQEARPVPRTGVDVEIQPANHIEVGAAHEPYNSDPPTSGPHYAQAAEAGFYDAAPADENLVHSLEHGYVIISYNCSALSDDGCEKLKQQILDAMSSAGNSPITNTPKLIAVPRPAMDAQIALSSWGHLDKLDSYDRARILNYIRAFRDQAPENNAP